MNRRNLFYIALLLTASLSYGQSPPAGKQPAVVDLDTMPKVNVEGLKIDRYMQEPHIINPSALCFDKMGRLYVGAGPQYRGPKEDSATDYIKILIDSNHDGVVDDVKKFAEGFNSIQGMVWRDNELWVANSPDLTVLIDTDGDDVADVYRVVYRGLNTLRHGLHGLNWAPDGKLYMSYGNTRSGDHAPQVIRDLQGFSSKESDKNPYNEDFTAATYKKGFRTLKKQETEGGIFRCDRKGENLEIFSRGLRNPWDITFDTEFNWLGTDNDPGPQHDRIFMPIEHGHYTMRHPYKFDWTGKDPAIAPVAKLFPTVSGSGTGVIFNQTDYFGKENQNSYFIADWTNKCVFSYKPKWEGAHQTLDGELNKILDGGLNKAGDLKFAGGAGVSLFRPTDIEIGPSGDLYIAGWGSVYGTEYIRGTDWDDKENAKYQGRIFRFHNTKIPYSTASWNLTKRKKPMSQWTFAEVMEDMGHHLPVWRTNAQDEMVRRGIKVKTQLRQALNSGKLSTAATTWTIWTLAHIEKENNGDFTALLADAKGTNTSLNLQLQAVRALGLFNVAAAQSQFVDLLSHDEPRLRHAALLGLQKVGFGSHTKSIFAALSNETDRVCNYTAFQVMRRVLSIEERKAHHAAQTGNVKAILDLALKEDGVGAGKTKPAGTTPAVRLSLSEENWRAFTQVTLIKENFTKTMQMHYTLDGSKPTAKSPVFKKALRIDGTCTLSVRIFEKGKAKSPVESFALNKISDSEWKNRLFPYDLKAPSDTYKIRNEALQNGVLAYGDRAYTFVDVPDSLSGSSIIQTANSDKAAKGKNFLSFSTNLPAEVYIALDKRNKPPTWLSDTYKPTNLTVGISDESVFKLYKAEFPAGKITLGANHGGSNSSSYHVFLKKVSDGAVTTDTIKAQLATADLKLGKEIFFGRGTCFACHKVGDKGINIGPDLQGINARRDMDYIIKSIIDPNAYIVEGYQQTVLTMENGSQLFGMVQEETGKEITLYLPTGKKKIVNVADIKKRDDNPNSGMPASFSHTLSSKDIADMSAWIMSLKAIATPK
jgi:putative membrane-bound dehydrogenase-like protein